MERSERRAQGKEADIRAKKEVSWVRCELVKGYGCKSSGRKWNQAPQTYEKIGVEKGTEHHGC